MTNLVNGGAGFVGLNIVEEALRRGETVIAFDRSPIPEAALAVLAGLPGTLRVVTGDITNPDDVARVVSDNAVQRIFHGAAVTSDAAREKAAPELVIQVNLLGLINVIKAADAAGGVRRIINISSGSAYGDGGFGKTGWSGPLDEHGTREEPTSLYAISKYASERVCRRLAELMDLDIRNVRLSAIFGPWERDTGLRDTLSSPMQASLLAKRGEVAVLARREARDWTYSRDVAKALFALMMAETPRHDLYNITSATTWSVLDWCEQLAGTFPEFRYRLAEPGETPTVDLFGDRDRIAMAPDRLRDDIGHVLADDLDATYADFAGWLTEAPDFWPE